jgi:hypothetical protein
MLRLAVLTSEGLRKKDFRYLEPLSKKIKTVKLLKIGHWGDVALEHIPAIVNLVKQNPKTFFWWYTKKLEIAFEVNVLDLPNLRSYLSLDPTTDYPTEKEYPYGITYFFGDGQLHKNHIEILNDIRLTALFTMKNKILIEDPSGYGLSDHPKICIEKKFHERKKKIAFCMYCSGRCNYSRVINRKVPNIYIV